LLVLVNGPAPDKDIDGARQMVADGIAAIVDHAEQSGIRLGIEPLHPMFAADRSVIVTMSEANAIAEQFRGGAVGLVVDVYHVWWDPEIYRQIERAGERIFGFHVSDWIVPLPDTLMGRGLMGDGIIQLSRLREAVERAGYTGPIEVEIFNEALWSQPVGEIARSVIERFCSVV
jgi:sugar phosphate isomerase/epimerase